MPAFAYPGLDLGFGPEFWALLPAFVLVTVVGAMDTLGDAIAIQRVSRRKARAIDFGSVQGAMSADGVSNLLSGLAGTVPSPTYATGHLACGTHGSSRAFRRRLHRGHRRRDGVHAEVHGADHRDTGAGGGFLLRPSRGAAIHGSARRFSSIGSFPSGPRGGILGYCVVAKRGTGMVGGDCRIPVRVTTSDSGLSQS